MIIPDCAYCGKQVVVEFDYIEDEYVRDRHVEAVEVCTGCGIAQSITHQVLPPEAVAEIRRDIRRAWRQLQRQRSQGAACGPDAA